MFVQYEQLLFTNIRFKIRHTQEPGAQGSGEMENARTKRMEDYIKAKAEFMKLSRENKEKINQKIAVLLAEQQSRHQ